MRNLYLNRHLSKKDTLTVIDKAMFFASFLYPLTAVPQLVSVLNGNVDGVSVMSWSLFFVFAFVALVYSSVHKIKPMIICYLLWCIVDAAIVIAILSMRAMS